MAEVFRMKSASGGGLQLTKYEDVIFNIAKGILVDPAKGVKFAREFKYKSGDILVCTYPKCGSHWIINMIWKLICLDGSNRGADTAVEFAQADIYDAMHSPRVIMSHFKPSRLPLEHLENKGKIILLLRNPKDDMVSMFHHWRDAVLLQNTQTWDELFESYITGITPCGSYFDYVQQWEQFLRDKPTDQHVEVFYYEDLKSNLNYNIARLNSYLGFNRDRDYIEKVLEATTMSALRKQDAAGKRETFAVVRDEKGDSIIYRKGEVGDWKTYFTVAQSETVDRLLKDSLRYGILNIKCEI